MANSISLVSKTERRQGDAWALRTIGDGDAGAKGSTASKDSEWRRIRPARRNGRRRDAELPAPNAIRRTAQPAGAGAVARLSVASANGTSHCESVLANV